MNKLEKHISRYTKSVALHDLGVNKKIEKGNFIWNTLDQELYLCTDVLEELITVLDLETGKCSHFVPSIFVRAYLSSEIGEMLPIDYTLPIQCEDGWAMVTEDNDVVLIEDDDYYESEIDARMSYLIYFLKLKILKPEEVL